MTAIAGAQTPSSDSGGKRRIGSRIGWWFLDNGVFVALIVELLIFIIIGKDKFIFDWTTGKFNMEMIAIILQTTAAVGIIEAIYCLSMISGITDFGGAPLTAVLFATLFTVFHIPWPIALLASMVASLLVGIFNAWVVIRLRIPPIVTTLITGSIMGGVAYLLAENFGRLYQIKMVVPALRQLWTIKPLGLPLMVYLMFLLYILVYILLNHTKLGAHLYAIGSNPDAAQRAGINYVRLFIFVFILLNIFTGLANILYGARVMNTGPYVSPNISSGAGVPITLVASLFAGIGLFGGTGRVEFTLVGLLFFAVLMVGMTAIPGFPAQLRVAVDGIAIVSALVLDALRRYLSTR